MLSKSLFVVLYLGLLWLCLKVRMSFDALMAAALAAVVIYGMLAVGAHENHMTLVLPAALAIIARVPSLRTRAMLAVALPVVNTLWFAGPTGSRLEPVMLGPLDPSILGAVLFLIVAAYIVTGAVKYVVEPLRSLQPAPS